ncbi:magnesium/cobalt transporter CorA [Roseivirga echinicomitans]
MKSRNPIDLFRIIPLDIIRRPRVSKEKSNLRPGSLLYTGKKKDEKIHLQTMVFNGDSCEEQEVESIDALKKLDLNGKTLWLNVTGLHNVALIEEIGRHFDILNIVLEDVLNLGQRPKWEEYDDYFFQVCKMVMTHSEKIKHEQFAMVVGKDFIVTFQEDKQDIFDGVRNRLRNPKGKIRSRKPDYLAFALMDVIVDHYIIIIEMYGDRIDELENELLDNLGSNFIHRLSTLKKEVNWLRRTVRPIKESVINFNKSPSSLIDKKTSPFLKDLLDHATHLTENVEVYMVELKDLLDHYNNQMNNRLNDILKVLTIFSVIFIPLTFMAGIYGMNFEYFPELSYKYAYPIFWGAMLTVAAGMIYYFKRKGWL